MTDEQKTSGGLCPNRSMNRVEFLRLAFLFQGGLFLAGLIFAGILKIDLSLLTQISPRTIVIGILATLPMLLFLWLAIRFPIGPLGEVQQILDQLLGRTLVQCRWLDLVWISILAGVSEEVLFRGVLQTAVRTWTESFAGNWSILLALVVASVVFGMLHWLSNSYAILAGILGAYLGLVFVVTGESQLLPPIIAHTLYDLVALTTFRSRAVLTVSQSCFESRNEDEQ